MEQLIFPLLILLLAVPMFLSVRSQKRQQRAQQEMQNAIVVGDRVMTTSGLFGTVTETTEDSVDIEIADGMVTTWLKAAVREKVNPTPESDEETPLDDADGSAQDGETVQPVEAKPDEPGKVEAEKVDAEKNAR